MPSLEAMLQGLDPRTETRLPPCAARDLAALCRGDRVFELKTMARQAQLRLDEDCLAAILREATRLEEQLLGELSRA